MIFNGVRVQVWRHTIRIPPRFILTTFLSIVVTAVSVSTVVLVVPSASAEVFTYWNFNEYDGDAHTINASFGSGVLQINPGWDSSDLGTDVGTTKNVLFGDPAGTALNLLNHVNNDRWIEWHIDTTGYQGLIMSFAIRSTNTGFLDNTLSWSVDNGGTFTEFGTFWGGNATWPVLSYNLTDYTELDNRSNVIMRFTMGGATSTLGSTRIDNMKFAGGIIPSPGALALLMMTGLSTRRRRR